MQRLVALTRFLLTGFLILVISSGQPAFAESSAENSKGDSSQSAESKSADEAKSSDNKPSESAEKKDEQESKSERSEAKEDEPESEADSDENDSEAEKEADKKDDEDKGATAKKSRAKKEAKKKPKPYKVKTEELKIEVELDGIFVADEMEEVVLRPEVWSRFKVLEAVEHGETVKKGDILIRFDDEKLEKDLADEALDQSIGQLTMLQDEEEFPRVKRQMELAFEEAERRHEQTKADYQYYHSTDRPFMVQIANYRYKAAEEDLAAAQEELKQLQQMYEADELTEETEEIVLRRQRFAVETAELVFELNKENRDYTLNIALPRSDEYYESALESSTLAYEQAKTVVELGMTRKNYDMEKKRNARAESVERHGKLLSDKGLMVLRAPCDGVVYYGKQTNGKWSQISSMKAKLRPFGSVGANSVLLTIVKPGGLHILSSIGEKQLTDVRENMKATIIPAVDKELELEGKVTHVDQVPGASNKFQVKLEADLAKAPEWLVAGMTCDAKVIAYENEESIVVPLALVQTDEDNKKKKYVMLVDADEDEPVRRDVKLGRKKGKIVEVLKGLEAGDEIVKEEKKDEEDDD